MDKQEQIAAERNELNNLINEGVKITLEYNKRRFPFSKPVLVKEIFTISQPTLAVIDLMSAEAIDLIVDEDQLQENPFENAKQICKKSIEPISRYIAIAILGRDAEIPCNSLSKYPSYKKNEKEIKRISTLIKRSLNPGQLKVVINLITQISNIGDFINSIRLAGESRSTTPNRIEGDED